MEKEVCTKKKFSRKVGQIVLNKIISKDSKKRPWRDEISLYRCSICRAFHLSSMPSDGSFSPKSIDGKSYFDVQKEKWGSFLTNFSKNNAVISKRNKNKKYST